MKLTDVFNLLGGLALFLYGMQMMSTGLEAAAGNRMKQILEKLTSNRFLAIIVGAGITAAIQSSSATTVMVVGFVNSGMMTLKQAVWIIMGANIGTTITGQLIALDIGLIAPLFAFFGVVLVVFLKNPKLHHYGQIIAGLGVLFIGMDFMSGAMYPLRESEAFVSLMTRFSNPVLGILAGMIFTALIQSSSASIGILQTLAMSGLIGLPSAVYVLFGQNIGTCITAVLASIGTSRNAKRATLIHLFFNVIGTTLFTAICILTPMTSFVASLTPSNPAAQIANMHTIFNIVTTLILIPFGYQLTKLSQRILPELPSETPEGPQLVYLKPISAAMREYQVGTAAIVMNGLKKEIGRMADMVKENIDKGFLAVLENNPSRLEEVGKTEDYIDFLNKELANYISKSLVHEANSNDTAALNAYFKITGNLERIGDHAMNICEYSKTMEERHISFSSVTQNEITAMRVLCLDAMELLGDTESQLTPAERLAKIAACEQKIDDVTLQFRQNQIGRMREGICPAESCVMYSEMLTDFERIGDHILNIGEAMFGTVPAEA